MTYRRDRDTDFDRREFRDDERDWRGERDPRRMGRDRAERHEDERRHGGDQGPGSNFARGQSDERIHGWGSDSRSYGPSFERGMSGERSYDQTYDQNYVPNFARGQADQRNYGQSYGPDYARGQADHPNYGQSYGSDYARGQDRERYGQGFDRGQGWAAPGPHSGRGPKGYRRSDERIKEEVCERLARHGHIDASEIEVEVSEGIVTLRGSVDERRSKRLAEDVIEEIHGVADVHNELRVQQRGGQGVIDRVKDALS